MVNSGQDRSDDSPSFSSSARALREKEETGKPKNGAGKPPFANLVKDVNGDDDILLSKSALGGSNRFAMILHRVGKYFAAKFAL